MGMMYFNTAYLAKLYIMEVGSDAVRSHPQNEEQLFRMAHGRVELAFMFHRKIREGATDHRRLTNIWGQIQADETSALLSCLPLTPQLLEAAAQSALNLPPSVFLRASDALHLVCAREHGFRVIHSNDKHLLAAAKHFGLRGKNIIK
jgi:predicted nucleic acid-binding protein